MSLSGMAQNACNWPAQELARIVTNSARTTKQQCKFQCRPKQESKNERYVRSDKCHFPIANVHTPVGTESPTRWLWLNQYVKGMGIAVHQCLPLLIVVLATIHESLEFSYDNFTTQADAIVQWSL